MEEEEEEEEANAPGTMGLDKVCEGEAMLSSVVAARVVSDSDLLPSAGSVAVMLSDLVSCTSGCIDKDASSTIRSWLLRSASVLADMLRKDDV